MFLKKAVAFATTMVLLFSSATLGYSQLYTVSADPVPVQWQHLSYSDVVFYKHDHIIWRDNWNISWNISDIRYTSTY